MIANIIGAGIGAALPIIMEIARTKPDPEVAKQRILSQRQELIDRAIGAGQSQAAATKEADAAIQEAIAQAEQEGSFNFPGGEVLMGALLGGAVPWAAGKVGGMAAAGKFGKTIKGLAGGGVAAEAATAGSVSAGAAATPKTNVATVSPPASAPANPSAPDLVSADELAPVQMRAEALSRMQPSAMDIRNTRMLNGVPSPVRQAPAPVATAPTAASPTGPFPAAHPASAPTKPSAPVQDNVLSPGELDDLIASLERKPGPFPAAPMSASDDIAAQLESRAAYDAKRMALDNTDADLIAAIDARVPASRPQGPFPEFLPGEMQSRTPSAMLRPWESMPEVEGAIIRKQLGKLKADPRGVMASMRSPFPDMESERMRASLYGRSGG